MWVVWLSVGAALVGLILLIDRLLKERIGEKLYRKSQVLRLPKSELDVIIRQAILDKTSRLAVWAFEGLLNQQKNPSATWQFLFEELRKVPEANAVAVLTKVLEKAESHHIGYHTRYWEPMVNADFDMTILVGKAYLKHAKHEQGRDKSGLIRSKAKALRFFHNAEKMVQEPKRVALVAALIHEGLYLMYKGHGTQRNE